MRRFSTAVVVITVSAALAPAARAALTFTPRNTFSNNGNSAREFALADLNGDGTLDAVTVNFIGNVILKRNVTPDGGQTPVFDTNLPVTVGSHPSQVAIGDVNGDGAADV